MRTFKVIFNTIRSMSFTKILKLLSAVLPHPLFSILSFYATVKAFSIAQNLYPKTASKNGEGNAFRHSLWCCFILMYCSKISSPEKALNFCKKITDLHEELFPNEPLETKMDLHNNKTGMDYFMELLPGIHRQFFEKSFFIEELQKKTANAKILKNLNDDFAGELVYLDEK
ncbi:DUF6973 domain-containing protein [Chryseobacterium sp. JAH]|uniref:DUF6973 domain-containing protein n=1 Tax=Chryseobacterium sp. JAH TaxID=1742858 RepID=UPI00074104E0|nr:hypothetical protein [Chryseobacterium sp. JAH]KUJ52103.1 hypothetical protein AR685_08705 [Chryseobacterium sp. JAH]